MPSPLQKNPGRLLDPDLNFESHISNVIKNDPYHLRNIADGCFSPRQILRYRLDCCNALFSGLPTKAPNKLQIIQTASTHARTHTHTHTHYVVPQAALGVPLGEFPYKGYTGQALGPWGGALGTGEVGPSTDCKLCCKLLD